MRILMDISSLNAPFWTGIATYAWSVASGLRDLCTEDSLAFSNRGRVSGSPPDYRWSGVAEQTSVLRGMAQRSAVISSLARPAVEQVEAMRILASMKGSIPDVYFEPNIVLKRFKAHRRVVTIHDLSFWNHPEWFPPEAASLKVRFVRSLQIADAIITGSESIKDELCHEFGISRTMVHVVYHGVDHELFTVANAGDSDEMSVLTGAARPYILCVGSLEPRKNLLRLLEAYSALKPSDREQCHLVIAGGGGWRQEQIRNAASRLGSCVSCVGYVDRRALASLYRHAALFVYPSLYEGFGLPPLEAMACGAPVLLSDIPVFREIFGTSALFCDPMRVESITQALESALASPGRLEVMRKRGVALAQGFSWSKSAAAHLTVLHEATV